MQVLIKTKNIRKALELGCSVIEKKSTLPVLSNIKLEAIKGEAGQPSSVKLTSTDMFLSLQSAVPAEVIAAGPITIPARTLFDIVRKVPDDAEISLAAADSGGLVKIDLPFSNFSLPSLPAEEFPTLESNDNYTMFSINAGILLSLFDRTKHAVSNEEIRYYLNGIYLHTEGEGEDRHLVAIATDGHRLAKVKALAAADIPNIDGVIIHKKTIAEVVKLLESSVGDIQVGISANKILFQNDSHSITSKVVDGKFPDYRKAIPNSCDKSLCMQQNDILKAIDLVTAVSPDKNRTVKMSINGSKVTFNTSSEFDGAKGTQTIEVQYDDSPISFGFNARYLVDAISAIEGDEVKFSFTDSMAAVVCEDPSDPSYIAILMPMQI